MVNKWTRCNISKEEPYMGSSLLQCRRWQGQQMQIVESSIHGSQTFWCLLTTLVFKLDPDWCYCHGPPEWCQKLAKFSSSSAERKQKSGGSQILTLAQTGDNFQALLVLCFHVHCRTEPEKMQERRQKRGGTLNTNSGQDCSWEESGSGWYLAPSSSSLVWHKSFPYTYKQDSLQKRRRQKQRAQQNLKAIFHPIQCGHSAYLSNFRVTLSESKKINQDFK